MSRLLEEGWGGAVETKNRRIGVVVLIANQPRFDRVEFGGPATAISQMHEVERGIISTSV
jgi:hypothetical protein